MFSETLSKSLPTSLITMLGRFLQKAIRSRILLECGQDRSHLTTMTYDLVNCGPNTRFQTSNGLIAHNCLALSYGMGPKKMVKQAYDKGHILNFDTAKRFYKEYWDLFEGVRRLERKLAKQVERKSWIVNPFGYRLTPEPHKAFNYFIQSTVSGIMHLFRHYLAEAAPWALFVTCIHDELLMDVPAARVEEFRRACLAATAKLNANLKWSVDIRTGFVAGSNWYESK